MSMFSIPKELRLNIWAIAYFAQPPRLVALRTEPHDETHDEDTFCPRYSPTPSPTVVNICHEARAEAYYQARKAGHLVRLHRERLFVASHELARYTEEFYFRFETDILYLPMEDEHSKHFDDSPEVGLLCHFRKAMNCDVSLLQNVAVTKVICSGFHDGSLSNCLREFPNISRIIMMLPEEVGENQKTKSLSVRGAFRILRIYEFDMKNRSGDSERVVRVSVDFAILSKGGLALVPKETWKDWSDVGYELSRRPDREQSYE
jgi:hypothetical protein